MSLATDPRPPLPEWMREAYTVLTDTISEQENNEHCRQVPAIYRDDAIEVLLSTDELDLEPEDTDYALTRLFDRGYFYEVDRELRVTTPSET